MFGLMIDELTRRVPTVERRVMTGVGHVPNWTDPRAFAALIDEIVGSR